MTKIEFLSLYLTYSPVHKIIPGEIHCIMMTCKSCKLRQECRELTKNSTINTIITDDDIQELKKIFQSILYD